MVFGWLMTQYVPVVTMTLVIQCQSRGMPENCHRTRKFPTTAFKNPFL